MNKEMDVDMLYYNAVDLLKDIIQRPSYSRSEDKAADHLASYIKYMDYLPHRKGNNIWIVGEGFDEAKPTILLNSHIDTVKPVLGWSKDPHEAVIEDDKLYGLGSNDAGGSLVCLLHAFFYLSHRPQSYNLVFLASCEEEVSGSDGIELALPYLPTPSFAIVGEPTLMQPAIAEKGLMVLDCVAIGKSGHAARHEGDNALYKAMTDIDWFRNYTFEKKSDMLGAVKMTVTMINAGTQHNVVPDRCTFVVDVRSNELYSNQELFDIIDKHTECAVKARSYRLNSSSIDASNTFVQRAIWMNKAPFGSPTMSDQALMPFPSVKIGPGDSARSHSADEYITLSEIREGLELYIKMLDGLRF